MPDLVVSSPHLKGDHVGALQKAHNRLNGASGYGLPMLRVDRDFGLESLELLRADGYYLGLPDLQLTGPLRDYAQVRILDPRKRTADEQRRGRARYVRRRRQLRGEHGPAAALAWARAQVGTKESPYGSNRGAKVSAWQRRTAGIDGQPWCGAYIGMVLLAAGVMITPRIVYVPYIVADGHSASNGMLTVVSYENRRGGDLVAFNFGDGYQHVGILDADRIHTFEGNTSSDDGGSQDNGGVVARRLRSRATMAAIIRPRYT